MNSLVPSSGGRPPVPPENKKPARRRAAGASAGLSAPVHQAAPIRLAPGAKLRPAYWDQLGDQTRQRLLTLSGPVLAWFAKHDSTIAGDRPRAVVFGELGLAIADPRVDTDHKPVSLITAFQTDPTSLGREHVDHRPPRRRSKTLVRHKQQPPRAATPTGIHTTAQGILGNLPPRAQELLQAPFLGDQQVRHCDWYYEGHDHNLDPFMIFLAGEHDVTAAVGTRILPAGHDDNTAHWSLHCYRATVRRRIGR